MESDLVRAARAGDRDAFDALAVMHVDRPFALARLIDVDPSDGIDVGQPSPGPAPRPTRPAPFRGHQPGRLTRSGGGSTLDMARPPA